MCDLQQAFYKMFDDKSVTYAKIGMAMGQNPITLEARVNPNREDRHIRLQDIIPLMTACKNLSPLDLINAHFGLSTFQFSPEQKSINLKTISRLMSESSRAVVVITDAMALTSPCGSDFTPEETQECLNQCLELMKLLMGIINALQKIAKEYK